MNYNGACPIVRRLNTIFKALNNSSNLIVDSRLVWFFISKSFKIFLSTEINVSANRILSDKWRNIENYTSQNEAIDMIIARKNSEIKRYMNLYGTNCTDLSNYDMIIDTSYISPEEVADIILAEYDKWLGDG